MSRRKNAAQTTGPVWPEEISSGLRSIAHLLLRELRVEVLKTLIRALLIERLIFT
jgi:hypothetical protein